MAAAGLDYDEAFLFEGRTSSFISTAVLRLIIASDLFGVVSRDASSDTDKMSSLSSQSDQHRCSLLDELDRLEGSVEQLKTIRSLELDSFGPIRYQTQSKDGRHVFYLDTVRLLRLVLPHVVFENPSQAHLYVRKVLQDRGAVVNVFECFLRHRNSKYAFLSLKASLSLVECAGGDLTPDEGRRERLGRLRRELLAAFESEQLLRLAGCCTTAVTAATGKHGGQLAITVSNSYPALRYKIKAGRLYFYRNRGHSL